MEPDIKNHIILVTAVFAASIVAGFYHASADIKGAEGKIEAVFEGFEFIKDAGPLTIFAFIFLNNSIKAIIATAAGLFFGIFPLSFIALNGYLIGLVVYVKGLEFGFEKTLLYLVPHGILEIPAIILACSYGTWLGTRFVRRLRGEDVDLKEDFKIAVSKCLKIVVPMLFVAALIETFVTPIVASSLH
ncbi:stage II sporulation protein M [Archaeoglobus veneficus]|uniref:Stage II sporulation protein M n=1 Tax=Archaeoglobus veneficus (strain DSM 11195 / SNP6) TaxID=693661 RepID=F2KN63_ARCVS|nr:stage II sporulation protein M [Archaeoglobus veneficus]AEA46164.1 protein of unknown function DUF95 transmembrane [Archaeoglobus veneficus SNP6]